ncbi:hypothetical protein JCM5350_003774 [Sporobolomyces pararoseus]
MRFLILSFLALPVFAFASSATASRAPELEWLFEVNMDAHPNTAPLLPGPLGTRIDVALIGGNFTGRDGLTGTMRPDAMDWARLDPLTGLAFADARWAIVTEPTKSTNGQDSILYVKSTGVSAPSYQDGTFVLHLRLVIETGVPEFYWMNNILAIGILEIKNINNLFDPTRTEIENVNIKAYSLKTGWKPTEKVFTTSQLPIHPIPAPPKLQWLFTVDLYALPNAAPLLPGPYGIRIDLAIVGGTFKGKGGLEGTIRNDTADWATIDPQTGIGQVDARWTIVLPPTKSTNGANSFIFVQSSGPSQKRGGLNRAHLRLKLETGVPEYYYLNNVLAVGVLNVVNPSNTSVQDVNIQVFNFVDDWSPNDKVFTCLYKHESGCDNLA